MESSLFASNPDLKSALTDLEERIGLKTQTISPLRGLGNRSFRVEFDQKTIALRLNAPTEHLGVDRQREKLVLDALQGTGISASVYRWDSSYLATDYLADSGSVSLASMAQTLQALHELPVPPVLSSQPFWTPADTLQDYMGLAQYPLPNINQYIEPLATADWPNMEYGLCHIDLNPDNILSVGPSGEAVFIDWEYARVGPLAYDIAVLFETHKLNQVDRSVFLDAYARPIDAKDIALSQIAYRLIEALWLHLTQPEEWPPERIESLAMRLDGKDLKT